MLMVEHPPIDEVSLLASSIRVASSTRSLTSTCVLDDAVDTMEEVRLRQECVSDSGIEMPSSMLWL